MNLGLPPLIDLLSLPQWASITLLVIDLLIRLTVIFWLPYNRKPVVALGWLMAIFFIPFVGLFAFLVFGSNLVPRHRRSRQRSMNQIIKEAIQGDDAVLGDPVLSEPARVAANLNYKLGALPLIGGNDFELRHDNNVALQEIAERIDQAKKYVHFEFYITALDSTTEPLWDALVRAHQRGVAVHVLIDHIGSRKYPRWRELQRKLNEAGVPWRLMLPLKPWKGQWQRPDLRNHRKIVVIDGEIAFSGSQNAIDRTYNLKGNIKKGLEWKDLSFFCTGPVVHELNAVFVSDWYAETKELLLDEIDADIEAHDEAGQEGQRPLAQIVPSGPGFETENNLRLINHLIYNAEERIIICSPYFVPEETLLQALTNMSLSGINVTLIVCEKGDQFLPIMGQRSYYEQLLRSGVKIQQYPGPTVLHSKFMIVDDEITFIGSSNMDPRSFALNFEVSTFIVGKPMVQELEEVARDYISRCKRLRYDEWVNRPAHQKIAENLCRLWSALL
ncbi:cardiolipin synthase [Rothia sp. SD9660Na]|uniref:cardiolipin synthase n=1 Tax=Rothia sp. SD9660Na TaxID=3047030 RepID=UPI0024BB0DCC|nr:cardiolipin synthase [Rothia sp. SD9660Na]WHS50240.1 cardiolipin synthase [Rothia sp. SD9660Na]